MVRAPRWKTVSREHEQDCHFDRESINPKNGYLAGGAITNRRSERGRARCGEGGVMEIVLVILFIAFVWGSGYFIGKMIAHKETLQYLDTG
jgi:hypothetical protein